MKKGIAAGRRDSNVESSECLNKPNSVESVNKHSVVMRLNRSSNVENVPGIDVRIVQYGMVQVKPSLSQT